MNSANEMIDKIIKVIYADQKKKCEILGVLQLMCKLERRNIGVCKFIFSIGSTKYGLAT